MVSLEQVNEEDPLGLVSDCRGERLAADDVPSCGFVFKLTRSLDFHLNLRSQIFVNLLTLRGLLDHWKQSHELVLMGG